jgi:hypothetical protein
MNLKNRRLSFLLPWLLVSVIVIVSFTVNLTLLNSNTAPPGADYGNYLTQVHILEGNDLRGWGLRHQPLFFVFLDLFLKVFDAFTALKVAASFVFAIVAIPFFFLAKKLSGNDYAAAISTGLFVFLISYSEMIAWGGNPNFLAFSFLLAALYFIIDLMKKFSVKNLLLSGLFLSLVVGTHILVAIFAFVSLFMFIILNSLFTGDRRNKLKVNLKIIAFLLIAATVFSLPYVSFYLNFFKISSSEIVNFQFFAIQLGSLSLSGLWGILATFFIIGVIGGLGLFGLSKYFKENRSNTLLLFSLLLSPILLVLTTAQPIRWIYFVPIPFFLCFSIYLKQLFSDVKLPKRTTIILFTSLFIATMAVQTAGLTIQHFHDASKFYQFIGPYEIEALNWINDTKNTALDAVIATSGHVNDVGGGGNSYSWWVEGYADRICMSTGNLEYFSYQFERDEVRITNRIFRGSYLVDYGNLKVIEAYPAGTYNPEISTVVNGKDANLLISNDIQNQLFFLAPDGTLSVAGFYAENKTSTVYHDNNLVNITVSYVQDNFELSRSVIVGENNSSVDIIYRATPINTTLSLFKLNLWSQFDTTPQNCLIDENNSVSLLQSFSNQNVTTRIDVVDTNAKLEGTRIIFSDLEKSKPDVNYSFEPTQNNLYVHIRVSVDQPTSKDVKQPLTFYDSNDLIKELNISYIMLNRYRTGEFDRFTADPEHFTVVFQNYSIIIFKVNK